MFILSNTEILPLMLNFSIILVYLSNTEILPLMLNFSIILVYLSNTEILPLMLNFSIILVYDDLPLSNRVFWKLERLVQNKRCPLCLP